MASPKAGHYEQQLLSALCRGAWADMEPAKSPKGEALNWNELIRKFRKHNPHSGLATVAVQTQTLALLLARQQSGPPAGYLEPIMSGVSRPKVDLDDDREDGAQGLRVGQECKLEVGSRKETDGNIEELRSTNEKSAPDSLRLTEAYYAYARGEPSQCIQLISTVDLERGMPAERTATRISAVSRFTHHSYQASVTSISEALTQSAGVAGAAGGSALPKRGEIDIGHARIWWTIERLRSRCLEGMSYETLGDAPAALRSYETGISLLELLAFRRPDAGQGREEGFLKYRELWRWAERLLWRASIVSAQISPLPHALRVLRVYHLHGYYWVPTFRPFHRCAVYSVYLRALCFSSPLDAPSTAGLPSYDFTLAQWTAETRSALEEHKIVLQATTAFPRAGNVNRKVIDFADLCIAVWEKGGESEDEAAWLAEMMWWATTLTFHSHRVMRHLTRLLIASGSIAEAKRTFRLYVQLVTKARETSAGDVSLQLKRRPTGERPAPPEEIAEEEGIPDDLGIGRDADGDRTFVGALVLGIRMLCRWAENVDDVREAWKMAELAREILESSKVNRDRVLHARVKKAGGIARGVQAALEMDPETRPKHQAASLDLLQAASALDSTSADTFYHLAYLQAESRDIDAAVLSARQAVERDSREIRAWHLLGLLLTAQGDNQGALTVLQLGLEEATIQDEMERERETVQFTSAPQVEGLASKDYATNDVVLHSQFDNGNTVDGAGGQQEAPSASRGSTPGLPPLLPTNRVPMGYTLHKPFADVPLSRGERFESTLQLRITWNIIIELLEGAESASIRWLDIFSFFSEKCPSGPVETAKDSRRNSIDSATSVPGAAESIRHVDTLSTVNEAASIQIPRVVTHPPRESLESDNGRQTGSPTHYERDGHRLRRRGSHRDGQRVDLNELRLRSHKLLQGGQKHIQSLSRKIIHRDGHHESSRLQRSNSTPDFKSPSSTPVYQASSIHSRMPRYPSPGGGGAASSIRGRMSLRQEVMTPPPPPSERSALSRKSSRETRMLSDLWLTSSATFRRLGKLEQARAAIQEAEVLDPENPNVWVQLGLYHAALENPRLAVESFHKALVIDPDHIAASVHLAQQYLAANHSDLAAGLLTTVTQGPGWDVAEAWYFLAKACAKLGRRERERECLVYALKLEETKTIRPLDKAVPRCL